MNAFNAAMIMDGAWELTGLAPTEETFIEAAQFLIDNGMAWQLQGRVGRTCMALIEAGHCTHPQMEKAQ